MLSFASSSYACLVTPPEYILPYQKQGRGQYILVKKMVIPISFAASQPPFSHFFFLLE